MLTLATKPLLAAAVVSTLVAGATRPAFATSVEVPGDYATIQLAIWAVSPGDTILVSAGVYSENLILADGIVIRSVSGPAVTTIDGGGVDVVLTFMSVSGASVEGFTLQGGSGGVNPGGAVHATGSIGRIAECVITSNFSFGDGGAIYLSDSDFVIEDNVIRTNYSFGNGAGIAAEDGSEVEVRGNVISDNEVVSPFANGGGIYLEIGAGASTIAYNVIVFNRADEVFGAGAGVYCGASDADIDHNTIVDNGWVIIGAGEGGVAGGGGLGVGLFLISGSSTVHNNIIGIVSPGFPVEGAGVYCAPSASPTFSHNDVWLNDAFSSSLNYDGSCGEQAGENGNISEDPEFCYVEPRDYTIASKSPCAGEGEGGSDIGALGIGCFPTATESATWGAVKTRFTD